MQFFVTNLPIFVSNDIIRLPWPISCLSDVSSTSNTPRIVEKIILKGAAKMQLVLLLVGLVASAPVLQQKNATQPYGATNATDANQLLGDDPSKPTPTTNSTQLNYHILLTPQQTYTVASPPTADYIRTPAFLASNPSFNFSDIAEPQPIRGDTGETALLTNHELDRQNPDSLAPPSTDCSSTGSLKWPVSLSHNRLEDGGFARQQNVENLPAATQIAGVDFRLAPCAYRELHWHTAGEWSYMIKGSARIAVVDTNGGNYIDNSRTSPVCMWR